MKKLFSLLTLALLTMSAWAATEVTINFSEQNYTNGESLDGASLTVDGVTLTYAKNNGNNPPAYYNTGSNLRFYAQNTLKVEATKNIISIAFTYELGNTKYIVWPAVDNGTIDANGNWSGNNSSITFTNDQTGKQVRLVSMTVTLNDGTTPVVTVAAPSLPASQTFEESLTVAITNNEEGATLYYSTDGAAWTEYTQALTLTETTTVYAKAAKNGVESATVSATYTKVEPATGVATLAAANGLEDGTEFMFTGDAVVTYHNGKYLFVRDASGYGLIYYDAAPAETFANGAVLNQNWTATKTTYRSLDEFMNPANVSASGVSNSALAAVQTIQASQMADMINAYVKIEHVKSISGTTATLTDGTTIALFNRFTDVTIPEFTDQDCSITGIVSIYNDALQLYFIESDYNSGVTPVEGTTYELVTNAASLAEGDNIIIVNNEAAKAMGEARTNNYGAVDVTINNNIIVTDEAQVITLEAQGNNWALKTADGYLYAPSSSANQLKAKAEVDSNAIASISIDDAAAIIFQGSSTRNTIRYNKSSVLFSCYASGQEPVYIYKATGDVPPVVTVEAPVLAPDHNTKFVNSQEVTITCVTQGATIYYTTDSVYQVYTQPFTINATTTVKAYAELNGVTSATVSAKYIKLAEVSTIAEANALDNKVDFIFYGNAVVTYQNGKNLWIRDASGSGLIYGSQIPILPQGTVLAEEWDAQKYDFRGGLVPEFQYPNNVKAAEGEPIQTVEPFERQTLELNNVNEYVIMKGLTIVPETDQTIENYQKYYYTGADSLVLYNQFGVEFTIEEGKTYDVIGTVTVYNEKPQLYIISVTEAAAPAGLRGDANGDGTVSIADVSVLIDYLLSKDESALNMANADCNLDQTVSIADVSALIDYLLAKTW